MMSVITEAIEIITTENFFCDFSVRALVELQPPGDQYLARP